MTLIQITNRMKKRILIVDNDYKGLLEFRSSLSKAGYHIMTAMDHNTVEKLMEVTNFDYILFNVDQMKFFNFKDNPESNED